MIKSEWRWQWSPESLADDAITRYYLPLLPFDATPTSASSKLTACISLGRSLHGREMLWMFVSCHKIYVPIPTVLCASTFLIHYQLIYSFIDPLIPRLCYKIKRFFHNVFRKYYGNLKILIAFNNITFIMFTIKIPSVCSFCIQRMCWLSCTCFCFG